MPSFLRSGFSIATVALCTLMGCATEDVALEHIDGALSVNANGPLSSSDATCLWFYGSLDDGEVHDYEVLLNGLPVVLDYDPVHVYGATKFCVPSGDYDIALKSGARTVAHTGLVSLLAQQSLTILYYGKQDAPTMRTFDTDNTDPGEGLRRLRVSNLSTDHQPLQLAFFDAANNELVRSPLVAYGETWSSIGPDTIASYGPLDSNERFSDAVCTFRFVIGVLVEHPLVEVGNTVWDPLAEGPVGSGADANPLAVCPQ